MRSTLALPLALGVSLLACGDPLGGSGSLGDPGFSSGGADEPPFPGSVPASPFIGAGTAPTPPPIPTPAEPSSCGAQPLSYPDLSPPPLLEWSLASATQLASGTLWGLTADETHLYVSEMDHDDNQRPPTARVLSIDKTTLERRVLVTDQEGVLDPLNLVVAGSNLYIADVFAETIRRIAKVGGLPETVAEGVRGSSMILVDGALYVADYLEGGIYRVGVEDHSVTLLHLAPFPGALAAIGNHLIWSIQANDGTASRALMIGDLTGDSFGVLVRTHGAVLDLFRKEDTLYWTDYGTPASSISSVDLGLSLSPETALGAHDSFVLCPQPLSIAHDGEQTFFGADTALYAASAPDDAPVWRASAAGYVRFLALDDEYVYYVNPDGLFRVARPRNEIEDAGMSLDAGSAPALDASVGPEIPLEAGMEAGSL